MWKMFCSLLGFLLLSILPNPLLADCVDLSRYNSYVIEGDSKIVFYSGPNPLAVVTLQSCRVSPSADVRITTPYMCDTDPIMINGEKCTILSIESTASQ